MMIKINVKNNLKNWKFAFLANIFIYLKNSHVFIQYTTSYHQPPPSMFKMKTIVPKRTESLPHWTTFRVDKKKNYIHHVFWFIYQRLGIKMNEKWFIYSYQRSSILPVEIQELHCVEEERIFTENTALQATYNAVWSAPNNKVIIENTQTILRKNYYFLYIFGIFCDMSFQEDVIAATVSQRTSIWSHIWRLSLESCLLP